MNELRKIEYTVTPEESFPATHNCSGCGCKQRFINTKRFRVNANGNRLDVWLIYQCEKCKHTLNLSVYERIDKRKVPSEEYPLFLRNDEILAEQYGMDYGFFKKNRVEVDWESVVYSVCNANAEWVQNASGEAGEEVTEEVTGNQTVLPKAGTILVHNPHGIRVRPEKLVSIILNLSRSAVKKLMNQKLIEVSGQGMNVEIRLYENLCGG